MDQNQSFEAFLAAVAQGEEEAIARLCHDFGPVVIRAIARRFEHSHLQAVFDPSGIWDRLVMQFRLDFAAGKCSPHTPAQLIGLLRNMGRCRAIDMRRHYRHELAGREPEPAEAALGELPANGREPWETLDRNELLRLVRNAVSDDAWELLLARARGQSWQAIAWDRDDSPDAVRMRYARLMACLREDLAPAVPAGG